MTSTTRRSVPTDAQRLITLPRETFLFLLENADLDSLNRAAVPLEEPKPKTEIKRPSGNGRRGG